MLIRTSIEPKLIEATGQSAPFPGSMPSERGNARRADDLEPRGDYSLGAYAATLRDLLIVLGHRRATVVGHSLGGGIAMQFSYAVSHLPQLEAPCGFVSARRAVPASIREAGAP